MTELKRKVAVDISIERTGKRLDEQRLLGRTALLAKEPQRLDKPPAVERRALDRRGRILRQRGRRRGNAAAEPLERKLAVE